jgi:hypothetical protein
VIHPQAGDLLEEPQHLFALAPAVDHHRHRAEVHAVGRHEEQMAGHPAHLGHQHPDPHGAVGNVLVDAEEFLRGHRECEFVGDRAQVVHAGDVRATLRIGELLAGLLHAGVEVADDRLAPQHGLALQFQHQPQHAVGRRVLWAHVDDHRLILVGIVGEIAEARDVGFGHPQHRTDLAHQLLRGELAAGAELLLALVGGGDGALVVGGGRSWGRRVGHQVFAPLNCTGMRPIS